MMANVIQRQSQFNS